MLGLVSLIIALALGLWLFVAQGNKLVENNSATQNQGYSEILDAARAIPGAPQQ